MYHIGGCVSSTLIQYMCKSVQSSFDNYSINTVYVYTKAKLVGKRSPFTDQIRSYIKNRCILGIQAKDIMKYVVFMGTTNFLFHLSHGGVRNLKVV